MNINRPLTVSMRCAAGALLLLASAVLTPDAVCAEPAPALRFNFSNQAEPGATSVAWSGKTGAPLYDAARGYGFVSRTSALPARMVHTAGIRATGNGFVISEPVFETDNNFGMAFRVKAGPGTYAIHVRTTSGADDTTVAVSGMQTSRLVANTFWDAAGRLPNRTRMNVDGRSWNYTYVNGQPFIDIEVEPKKAGVPVGIEEITITPIALQLRQDEALPTVFTLGDSTVKSYTFDEAPMSGWGQVFDNLFDRSKLRIVNYSQGGRSFRNAYAEGRLNDLLMAGRPGDVVMIQFGHNDESEDETHRWGRGATEAMYDAMIRNVYLPAIRARGMIPVFVTPMSRVNAAQKPDEPYVDSFRKRRFPDIMRRIGAEQGITVVDLNARSVEYFNEAGTAAVTAQVMSLEAGETPGKTNDGSYANGHPANKIDGTHYKETLAKQYARIVVTELARLAGQGDPVAARLAGDLRPEVKAAIAARDWSAIYPEIAGDIRAGDGAYYRNQIEKLIQLGVLRKDGQGNFNPERPMGTREFASALAQLLQLPEGDLAGYADGPLTRELMGAIIDDAYHRRFKTKPAYMTEFNGKSVAPGMPGYDPNLDTGAKGAMYYPLVDWTRLTDTATIAPAYALKVKDAYELGLIRSEKGIARGRMVNGRELEPKATVTRAKAAKALYFMWVLAQPTKVENDTASRRIVVAADGSGDFRTVQEAINAVPDNSAERTVILIKPGVYTGQKILPKEKGGVTLQGQDAASTILTWDINTNEVQPEGANPRYKGTAFVVLADDFRADKLSFQNASGDHGQALALRIDGDRAVVTNSRLLGWQDTLMLNNGRDYFRDSYIEGRVDFIYGSATAVFDHCEIKSKNGGYVTAASTPADRPYGLVFLNSRLTSDPRPWVDPSGVASRATPLAYLGRPWRPYGSVTFVNTEMGAHIRPEGWDNWRNPDNEKTARYAEYNSSGPGANPAARVNWSKQLTEAQARQLAVEDVLGGSDGWHPKQENPR
jgi:pectin methylesterase-like acyl-CoA thioesterase/lysophospholipase L1-like esterase